MSKSRSFVVFGIGKRNTFLTLLKAELDAYEISLVGCDASKYAPARLAVDVFFQVPQVKEEAYSIRAQEILNETNALGFMTLIDPEVVPLSELSVDPACSFVHPNVFTSRLCEDKFQLINFLNRAGIPTIPTFLRPPDRYPYIVKDRSGSCASGFDLINGPSGRLETLNDDSNYVFQPVVTGEHYCVDAYFSLKDGSLVDFCPKQVLSKDKGESYTLKSIDRTEFIPLLDLIGSSLNLKGIVNLDVYRHEGELSLMEINCRVGGNYPASHAYGCNLLKPLINDLLGHEPSKPHSFFKIRSWISCRKILRVYAAPVSK